MKKIVVMSIAAVLSSSVWAGPWDSTESNSSAFYRMYDRSSHMPGDLSGSGNTPPWVSYSERNSSAFARDFRSE